MNTQGSTPHKLRKPWIATMPQKQITGAVSTDTDGELRALDFISTEQQVACLMILKEAILSPGEPKQTGHHNQVCTQATQVCTA